MPATTDIGAACLRILHVCRQYSPSVGGVERFVGELAARQAAAGHEVAIATLNHVWGSPARLPAYEVPDGIPVHRLPFVGGALFFVAPGILGLVGQFDLVHVHNTDFFLDYLTATRGLHRRPVVVSTHGGFFHTAAHSKLKGVYFQWVTCRSLAAAAFVVPNSLPDERRFGPCCKRFERIDNAINYSALADVVRAPESGRLVTIGRLAENKNLPGLLSVYAAALRRSPGLRLVIIGDGPLRAGLEQLAAQLGIAGNIIWRGTVADQVMRDELARADLFLSAARYEGFGLAAAEAMAAGVPVFVNRIEAFEAMVDNGVSGYLVDYDDVDSAGRRLAEAAALSANDKARMGQTARGFAARYSWEAAAPKFERIYREALRAARMSS